MLRVCYDYDMNIHEVSTRVIITIPLSKIGLMIQKNNKLKIISEDEHVHLRGLRNPIS